MEIVAALFAGAWEFLSNIRLLNIPVIYFLCGFVVLGLVMSFVVGSKK